MLSAVGYPFRQVIHILSTPCVFMHYQSLRFLASIGLVNHATQIIPIHPYILTPRSFAFMSRQSKWMFGQVGYPTFRANFDWSLPTRFDVEWP
ncbi:hypothetical protein AVEN_50792-1 [Araneus ventricosus]|uniref:Uncharacterized protein n=1 Tax=Araneus ventricosus TaxID=182803 RepID=A0A4Y2LK02_ARAVE|nr:hypothetical protein AVEN_31717-1 [Araneus ventricosus]GBN14749.1 hypothetical protein AVEN_50792-1 [Araneus ventricosus]